MNAEGGRANPEQTGNDDRSSLRERFAAAWLLPLAATLLSILILTGLAGDLERILAGALMITAGLNSALVAGEHFPAVRGHSVEVKHRLLDLRQHHRTQHRLHRDRVGGGRGDVGL